MQRKFWHDRKIVSQERLTRHEISWLLAQEARGAARALREGVSQLRQGPGAEPRIIQAPADAPAVETTLDALDDAITMLSDLNTGARRALAAR
jgi:two-component system, OmpR family, sensor kinase